MTLVDHRPIPPPRARLPRLRGRLALFTVACAGVAATVIASLLLVGAAEQHAAMRRQIQDVATANAQVLDREIAVSEALLTGLASSPALRDHDWAAFHRQARDLAAPRGTWILLNEIVAPGRRRVVLNTALPFGTPQPPASPETDHVVSGYVARIAATRQPQVSDVTISTLTGGPMTGIGIPIVENDSVPYVLAMVIPALDGSPIFHRGDVPPSWFSGVIDQQGNFVAGHRSPERAANLPVIDAAFHDALRNGGVFRAATAGGEALDVAHARSAKTPWISIVAVPRQAFEALWTRALVIAAITGSALILVTFGIALLAEPRVTGPLRHRLMEDEERFRVMANTVPGILFTSDPQGRCDYVSEAFYAFTGMAAGSAEGTGWMAAMHPDDRDAVSHLLAQPTMVAAAWPAGQTVTPALAPDGQPDSEIRLRGSDGAYRWFLIRARTVRDATGQPARRFGTATDIDDLKQTEQALRRSEQEIRRATAQLIRAQDGERRRIAREIHDTTLQDLLGVALQIARLRTGSIEPEQISRMLEDMQGLIVRSQEDLRTLSYLMHPPMLELLGLSAAIRDYAQGFSARSGIAVDVEAPRDLVRLFDDVEMTLFRVVQEGLANVYRHSGSADARIALRQHTDVVTLEITDRGKGLAEAPVADEAGPVALGVGIAGMGLRLQQIGGTLEMRGNPGGGTTLRATVPCVSPPGLTAGAQPAGSV